MKLVKCIVRDCMAEQTATALKALDLSGITVTEVRGRGRNECRSAAFRGRTFEMLSTNMMIDVVTADHLVDDIVRIVMETARTGRGGDGRIFVFPVEEAYTIRTRSGGVE